MKLIAAFLIVVFCIVNHVDTTRSLFSAKMLLTTPQRGPAIPNIDGTFAIYTESTYSLDDDFRGDSLYMISITCNKSSEPINIVENRTASNPNWLDPKTVIYVSTTNGSASL